MKDLSLYTPEVCDRRRCILDCERCPKRHIIEEMEANKMEDDDRLEMGFDPYLGCYTDDC